MGRNLRRATMVRIKKVAEKVWAGGGSLDIEMVAAGDDRLDFNVTRCRYAEFYKEPRPRGSWAISSTAIATTP